MNKKENKDRKPLRLYEKGTEAYDIEKKRRQRENNRRFRERHPDYAPRIVSKLKYNKKGQVGKFAFKHWTKDEDDQILAGKYSDLELVKILNRSVASIQTRRNRLKNKMKKM